MLKLSTNAQEIDRSVYLEYKVTQGTQEPPSFDKASHQEKHLPPMGNSIRVISDLGQVLCPWLSCRNRSHRWRSARLHQMHVWWVALPAFSRRRDIKTLKLLWRDILRCSPQFPGVKEVTRTLRRPYSSPPISHDDCSRINAAPDVNYITQFKGLL